MGIIYNTNLLTLLLNEQFQEISLLLLPSQDRIRPEGHHHWSPQGGNLHTETQLTGISKVGRSVPSLRAPIQSTLRRKGILKIIQVMGDADFKERHDLALRTISQLKNEIDALRADLREKNLEIGDL